MPLFSFSGKNKKSPPGTRADFTRANSESLQKGKGKEAKGKGKGGSPAKGGHSPHTPRTPRELLSQDELAHEIQKKLSHVRDACFAPLNSTMEQNSATPDKVELVKEWLEAACKGCQELQEQGQRLETHLELVNEIACIEPEFEELRIKVDLWQRGDLPASSGILRDDSRMDDSALHEDDSDDDEGEETEEEDGEGEESEGALRRREEEKQAEEARRKVAEGRKKLEEALAARKKREAEEEARRLEEEAKQKHEEEQAKQLAEAEAKQKQEEEHAKQLAEAEEAKRIAQEARDAAARQDLERVEAEAREAEEERKRKELLIEDQHTSSRHGAKEKDDNNPEKLTRDRITSDVGSRTSEQAVTQGAVDEDTLVRQPTEWFVGSFGRDAEASSFPSFSPTAMNEQAANPFGSARLSVEKDPVSTRPKDAGKRRSRTDDMGSFDQPSIGRQISSDASLKKGGSKSSLPEAQWNDDVQDLRAAKGWNLSLRQRSSEDTLKSAQKQKEKKKNKGESKLARERELLESLAFKDEWPAPWPGQQSNADTRHDSSRNQDVKMQDWYSWDAPTKSAPPPPTHTMSNQAITTGPSRESFSIPSAPSKDTLPGNLGLPNETIIGGLPPAVHQPSTKRCPSAPTLGRSAKQLPAELAPSLAYSVKPSDRSGKIHARMHIHRSYAEVAHDIESFKAQFVQAASLAAGVPPHRIRVKGVRPG